MSNLQPGTYSITISDDYSPVWLNEQGLLGGGLCADGVPAGGNTKTDSFTITGLPLPIPESETKPYESHPELMHGVEQKTAEELTAQAQAARKAREASVKAEQEAKEAPLRQALERAEREAAEVQAAEARASVVGCVVPSLVGRSLNAARRALARAHCSLGKVTRPRVGHGALLVIGQGAKHGKKLPRGARIAVRLGAAKS